MSKPNMGYSQGKVRFPPPSPPGEGAIQRLYPGTRIVGQPPPPILGGRLCHGVLPAYCHRLAGSEASACGFVVRSTEERTRLAIGVLNVRTGFRASFSSENLLKVDGRFIREGRKAGAAITDRIFRSRDGGQVVAASPFVALKKNSAKTFCSAAVRRHAGSSL